MLTPIGLGWTNSQFIKGSNRSTRVESGSSIKRRIERESDELGGDIEGDAELIAAIANATPDAWLSQLSLATDLETRELIVRGLFALAPTTPPPA